METQPRLIRNIGYLESMTGCGMQQEPKTLIPTRRSPTHGREFLLLLERGVLRLVWGDKIHYVIAMIAAAFLSTIINLVIVVHAGWFLSHIVAVTAAYLALNAIFLFVMTVAIPSLAARNTVLLPLYRKRALSRAQAIRDRALRDLNASIPKTNYRVTALPKVSLDSLPEFRSMADQGRLTSETNGKLYELEAAQAELEAAEQELDKLRNPFG